MHGIVFGELQQFVEKTHGRDTWIQLLRKASLSHRVYLAVDEYPDSEIAALVKAASEITQKPASAILEAFGEFIAPDLIKMYGHLLKPSWKTLDVIHNTEGMVHTVVRVKNPGARPPKLQTRREDEDTVVLIYTSPRQMCSLAKGIARGVAHRYNEKLLIQEMQCMHKGAAHCEIVFRKVG
jgi:predicted hydrocarbon binding protein